MKNVSRREFIRTGSLAAAGISLLPGEAAARQRPGLTVGVGVIGTGNGEPHMSITCLQ